MKITEQPINFPSDFLNRLKEGRLVIFAGAGVSARAYPQQRKPTFYPLFKPLAKEIARRLSVPVTQDQEQMLENGQVDKFLGELKRAYNGVPEIAAQILGENLENQRIDFHQSIIDLLGHSETPRLVTTNFDPLFSRAINNRQETSHWPTFQGPALPPAGRFEGLCLLHGSISDHAEMILTDDDIGRAYMDEGWALRFANGLFREFSVLFIGYSLEDPPLRYLALALEGTTQNPHWALLPEQTNQKKKSKIQMDWDRRGVTPIWFPAPRRDFRAQEESFRELALVLGRSFIEKREFVVGLSQSRPNELSPHKLDQTNLYLDEDEVLREFANSRPSVEWLEELIDRPAVQELLQGRFEALTESQRALTPLIVQFVLAHTDSVLPQLYEFADSLPIFIFYEFCDFVRRDKEKSLPITNIENAVELFIPSIRKTNNLDPFYFGPLMDRLLAESRSGLAIFLLIESLKPIVTVEREESLHYQILQSQGEDVSNLDSHRTRISFGYGDSKEHSAKELVGSLIKNHNDTFAKAFIRPAEAELRNQFQRQLRDQDLGSQSNWLRPTIEESDANRYLRGPVNTFVDAIRDCWECLLEKDPSLADQLAHEWVSSRTALIKRLGLFAAQRSIDHGVEPLVIITELIGLPDSILWNKEVRHEGNLLLRSYLLAFPDETEQVLEIVLAGPDPDLDMEQDRDRIDFHRFETLALLDHAGIALNDPATTALTEFSKRFSVGDFNLIGVSAPKPSKVPPEFIRRPKFGPEEQPPQEAVLQLLDFEPFGFIRVNDVADELGKSIVLNPGWGREALNLIGNQIAGFSEEQLRPLLWGIANEIRQSPETGRDLIWILEWISAHVARRHEATFCSGAVSVLREVVKSTSLPNAEWHDLAMQLTELLKEFDYQSEEDYENSDLRTRALNHPLGEIAGLFFDVERENIALQRQQSGELFLSDQIKVFLGTIVAEFSAGFQHALCIASTWIPWMESIDSDWTAKRFHPLLLFQRPEEVCLVCWKGYCWAGQFSRGIASNFDSGYFEAVRRIRLFSEEEKRGLSHQIAAAAWSGYFNFEAVQIAFRDTDIEVRQHIIEAFDSHLESAPAESDKKSNFLQNMLIPLWEWLCHQRFFTEPQNSDLRAQLMCVVPLTEQHFTRATEFSLAEPPTALGESYHLLKRLSEFEPQEETAESFLAFVILVLNLNEHPEWNADLWQEIWESSRNLTSDQVPTLADLLVQKRMTID